MYLCKFINFFTWHSYGVLIAYFFGPESYNIIDNYISDLGSIRYTPAPFVLDAIAMITACFLVPVFFYITKIIVSDNLIQINLFLKEFFVYISIYTRFLVCFRYSQEQSDYLG